MCIHTNVPVSLIHLFFIYFYIHPYCYTSLYIIAHIWSALHCIAHMGQFPQDCTILLYSNRV